MRTIDIQTTQKVTIQCDMAPLRDRIMAFVLDFFIKGALIIAITLTAGFISSWEIFDDDWGLVIFFILVIPVICGYTLIAEILMHGETPGKRALGIKVIRLNGAEPSIQDYFTRWCFRLIDVYFCVGVVATMMISASEKGQRLGDMMANTTLIKKRSQNRFSLTDILKINSLENHEPQYPQVRQYSEQDMLLVKSLIERLKKYPNDAHRSALNELCDKLKIQLELDEVPKNRTEFLRTLIKDYIVLTR